MKPAELAPALIMPLIAWRVFVRVKRNIGRQPWKPRCLRTRVIIFSVITVALGIMTRSEPPSLAGLGGGLILGVPLAWPGLRLTRFEATPQGKFYTPNTTIGVILSLLFIGRLVYRMTALYGPHTGPTVAFAPPIFQSPLTLLIFGVTAGYYIAYYAGVLWRGRKSGEASPGL